ncbi:phosphatidylinositol-specific phospholipase C [Diaporthe eres]|uniref:Phosphatidylinositol-specific phospholipase C X domain-containing protein n=1 Tax=Diaporthe vaccinii TaxID=105482 RepID=A0ABR4EDF6_9PEZI|nr:phosphatidylinositol-specific phospholipase C [Diaporthe eres]
MFTSQTRRSRTNIIVVAVLVVVCFYLVLQLPSSTLRTIVWSAPEKMPSYQNYTSSFSFDLDKSVHPEWMARVPDQTNLASLSIPGTHDTETFDLVNNTKFQCQNHDLRTQLRAGLRYFDIRGRLLIDETGSGEVNAPVIGIFHAQMYTGYTLEDVLLTLFEFLDQHPTEGIIMRLKMEGTPVRRKPGGTFVEEGEEEAGTTADKTTFEEAFNHYRLKNTRTEPGSTKHLLLPWPSPSAPAGSPLLPTMAQLRGRVIVLQEFPSATGASYGIPWLSPHISLEDLWIIVDLGHLEDKWRAIRASLEAAGASPPGSDLLFLSHLSASVGVTPIEAAAGPLEAVNGSMIEGMNDRTGRLLEKTVKDGQQGKIGVVMADFPGQRLVDAILARNAWLTG